MADEHPSQAGHWYKQDGTPAYTIIGKNGKERNTTLRDARALNLLPSVTSIIRCAAAPGLETWKAQQVLMAALTTDRKPEETEQDYISRIIADANEQAQKARERGTLIHAWVQGGFDGEQLSDEAAEYYKAARAAIEKECGELPWVCESAFATKRYGGKIDLKTAFENPIFRNGAFIIDFKTTDKDLTDIKTWPEHHMQLAAYDPDNTHTCGILYINYQAETKLIWLTNEEKETGWRCFNALLDFYYAKTKLGED